MKKVSAQICWRGVIGTAGRSSIHARCMQSRSYVSATLDHDVRFPRSNSSNVDAHRFTYNSTKLDVVDPPKDNVSIVFTDIVNSTLIWEKNADVMAAAMITHDDVVRDLTNIHQGYEVKQNGDGFMIAFSSPISALQFCLDAQQQLLSQAWPEELLGLSPGEEAVDENGNVLFRGLRLRMSVHWGSPLCRWNKVIRRMDYLGPMVNRAARFVEVTEGGQIVVSERFLQEVQRARGRGSDNILSLEDIHGQEGSQSTDQEFEVRLLGEHPFKGLSNPETLYFIIPRTLHGRLESWPKHKYVQGSKGNIVTESK